MQLNDRFQQHFQERGFEEPTLIQEQVFQPLLQDQDLLGIAPTGSGKTLAFAWPLLPKLMPQQGVQLVVLEPSQELAIQTSQVLREWGSLLGLRIQSLTGGANLKRQAERLKKGHPEVVVGTPGRVNHLLDERILKLHRVIAVVVDEADELLTDDSHDQVLRVIQVVPQETQLALFSATSGELIEQLRDLFDRDFSVVDVRADDHSRGPVNHGLVKASTMSDKAGMLERLSHTKNFRALVFFTSIKTLHYTASRLQHAGVPVASLGGKQRQTEREEMLRKFRKRQVKLLLTTDVAARGLDIPKLPAVVNFELPNSADAYVHRTGRTGRQGEPGTVINLGNDHDFRDLKKLLAETDYVLKPMTITKQRVMDQEKVKELVQSSSKDKSTSVTKDPKGSTTQSTPLKARKKKNRKNKGIRLKHRRKAQN